MNDSVDSADVLARQKQIDMIDPCYSIKQAIELKLDGALYKSYKKNPNFVSDQWTEKAQRRHKKFKSRKEFRVKTQTFKVLKAWRKQNLTMNGKKNSKQNIEREPSKPRTVKSRPPLEVAPGTPGGLTLTDKYFPPQSQSPEKNKSTVSVSDEEFWTNRHLKSPNSQGLGRNKSVNDKKYRKQMMDSLAASRGRARDDRDIDVRSGASKYSRQKAPPSNRRELGKVKTQQNYFIPNA